MSELNNKSDAADESGKLATIKPDRRKAWILITITLALLLGGVGWNWYSLEREAAHREYGGRDLYQIMLSLKMYATEDPDEKYPPMAPYENVWMFDVETMYPEYFSDLTMLVAPGAPGRRARLNELERMKETGIFDWERVARIAAESYVYPGWAITSLEQLPELARYRRQLDVDQYDTDIVDADENVVFYQLREGVERLIFPDSEQAQRSWVDLILLFDSPTIAKRRRNPGANVLDMGQTVRFERESDPNYDIEKINKALRGSP